MDVSVVDGRVSERHISAGSRRSGAPAEEHPDVSPTFLLLFILFIRLPHTDGILIANPLLMKCNVG